MPIVKVELFPGRSAQKKSELAKAITDALDALDVWAGSSRRRRRCCLSKFPPTRGLSPASRWAAARTRTEAIEWCPAIILGAEKRWGLSRKSKLGLFEAAVGNRAART